MTRKAFHRSSGVYRFRQRPTRDTLPYAPPYPYRATPPPRPPANCDHMAVHLADVAEWGDWPVWRCVACHIVVRDCAHENQQPTPTGWRCAKCHRMLLGPPGTMYGAPVR